MNIIKKYILNELEMIIKRCKQYYLDDSDILAIAQAGYYDIGLYIQSLYKEIIKTNFDGEIEESSYNSIHSWIKTKSDKEEEKNNEK